MVARFIVAVDRSRRKVLIPAAIRDVIQDSNCYAASSWEAMKRKTVFVVAGLVVSGFLLGVIVGARFFQPPVVERDIPVAPQFTSNPVVPTETVPTPPACVDIRNAPALEGKPGCVAGVVLRVYTARSGNSFLDFCQDYRACPFSSVIFAADKAKFGDVEALQGKRVEIRGSVVAYQGHAEIILHDPQQVRAAQ